jgi:quercetin dioxygenase-like cupin family protein
MEIVRFGVGHRRPEGPPGTVGLQGQVIHSDARGVVSELAFGRNARIEPHSNPNTTWFVVIEGGGWVAVGEEQTRIAAGEAVLWPAGIVHGAWTEATPMRAIVVEFAGSDDGVHLVLEGQVRPALGAGPGGAATGGSPSEAGEGALRGEGSLRGRPDAPRDATTREGEPY